jgi:hypothetical protein
MKPNVTTIPVRCDETMLIRLDEWRRAQRAVPTRATAIHRLGEQALAGTTAPLRRSTGSKRKAAEMAEREIDRLGDQRVSGEERAHASAGSSMARENFAICVAIAPRKKMRF